MADLRSIYDKLGGDYEVLIGRLRSESMIIRLLKKFVAYKMDEKITAALAGEDYNTAFMESHNLKGVCANLSMDRLFQSASDLTEALRNGKPTVDITPFVDAMQKDYNITIEALREITEE